MPRPRTLPLDDVLLDKKEAQAFLHVSESRWYGYVERYPALRRGRRLLQVNPDGSGVMHYLKSALIEHIHTELASERRPK